MRKPVGNKLRRCRCSQLVYCVWICFSNWNCGLTLLLPRVDAFIAFSVLPEVTIWNHRCKGKLNKKRTKPVNINSVYLESERRVSILICHILFFIWILGAHDACKFFKTECLPSEYCVPRVLSGMVWPGEYKCLCRKGWKKVRGRGCVGKVETGICACTDEKKCANLCFLLNCSRTTAWYKEKEKYQEIINWFFIRKK